MQELTHHLAHTLRLMRQERHWSLRQAADCTGVSKAMLGQIERGESSPTVATLWKIATGFNVPFSSFLEKPPPTPSQLLHNRDAAPVFHQTDAHMNITPLFQFDAKLGFDMFRIELYAGALSESSAHETGVIEHVIVLEGTLELYAEEKWHVLRSGEAIRFAADQPHAYRNTGTEIVVLHDLIHYPRQSL